MMMRAFAARADRSTQDGTELSAAGRSVVVLDAFDCPAVFLAGDTDAATETRGALQSLGFDVVYGTKLLDADEEPVLVMMSDYLADPQNRQRFDGIRALWPLAPVFTVCGPTDAVSKLVQFIS